MTSVRVLCAAGAIFVHLLAGESAAAVDLAIDAPPELSAAAGRISAVDQAQLAADLRRAGLPLPPRIRVRSWPAATPTPHAFRAGLSASRPETRTC